MSNTNSIGITLALIPAGEFRMGSSDSDNEAYLDERPNFQVEIARPFEMGVFPVTVAQFRQFIENSRYQTEAEADEEGGWGFDPSVGVFEQKAEFNWRCPGFTQEDDHPVVNVTWRDAAVFCRWLSRKEGVEYRLPTEAEWEYACRAGTTTRFWCGDDDASLHSVANVADLKLRDTIKDITWTANWDDGFAFTSPQGRYPANPFGLFDMHGNVWEWCNDWYDDGYYWLAPKQNPTGPVFGVDKVLRGGSWFDRPGYARSSSRYSEKPGVRLDCTGFRVVRLS